MIPFKNRFHGHSSLRYVYKNGAAIRGRMLTVKYVSNSHREESRFSVVISKKVHKSAVGRNRMRRRLYEIIRLRMGSITGAYDVVVIVSSSEILHTEHQELAKMVDDMFYQANLYEK